MLIGCRGARGGKLAKAGERVGERGKIRDWCVWGMVRQGLVKKKAGKTSKRVMSSGSRHNGGALRGNDGAGGRHVQDSG